MTMQRWMMWILPAVLAGAAGGRAAETNAPASATVAERVSIPGSGDLSRLPERIRPYVEEGFLELRVNNREAAIRAFRKALEFEPTCRQAMFGLGTALIAEGKYGEAAEVLKRAVEMDPQDYFVVNNLAWLYATARDVKVRDGKKAVDLARQALLIAPNDYHVWSTLAEAYYVCGEYPRAVKAAESARFIAQSLGLQGAALQEYDSQVQRCRNAQRAMDILE